MEPPGHKTRILGLFRGSFEGSLGVHQDLNKPPIPFPGRSPDEGKQAGAMLPFKPNTAALVLWPNQKPTVFITPVMLINALS